MTFNIEEQYDYRSDNSCKWKVIDSFEDKELALKELANLRYFNFRDGLYRLTEVN
jgi:hypothetical protein